MKRSFKFFAVFFTACVLACSLSLAADRPDPSAAESRHIEVLVGAKWCPECHRIERDYRNHIHSRGVIALDYDLYYRQLPRCQTLPALIIWDRDIHGGWQQPRIVTGAAIGIYLKGR